MSGKPAQNDLSVAWVRDDLLKAQNKREYVPVCPLDRSLEGDWRHGHGLLACSVEERASSARAARRRKERQEGRQDGAAPARPAAAYEDFGMTKLMAGMGRISRSFTVPAGAYDVYVIVKEADVGQEERAGAEDVGDQAVGHGAGSLDRRPEYELGHRGRAGRPAARAVDPAAAG